MAEQPAAEKTEAATPKRREDAKRKGDVAQSRDVAGVAVLTASLLAVFWALRSGALVGFLGEVQALWAGSFTVGTLSDYHALLLRQGAAWIRISLPIAGLLMVAGTLAPLVQVGPMFSFEALTPRFDRINPLAGIKRLVSPEKAVELFKALAKVVVVSMTGFWVLRPELPAILGLVNATPGQSLLYAGLLVARVAAYTLAAMTVVAVLDWRWTQYRHERKLRMTRQEVREEMKERDGQPELRSRMRSAQRELSRHRMMSEVASADLVIRNPTHFAIALRYERQLMGAPTVLAKGRGRVAQRILELARQHEVPIVENRPLARSLYRSARIGREIPESLYQAVAEVMAYVFRLDERRAGAWGRH